MSELAPPWVWKGIAGQMKGPFVAKVLQLMHTEFGVELSAKKTGKAYVSGSGLSQPHQKDTTLVSLQTAPSSKRSAGRDEGEPSTKRARREEAEPEEGDSE